MTQSCHSGQPLYFGLPVFTGSHADAIARIDDAVQQRRTTFVAALNVYKMAYVFRMPGFAAILASANMLIADGVSVLLTARALGCPVRERVTGVALFEDLLRLASRKRYRVFLLGGRRHVLDTVLERIASEMPGLVVAGQHDGFFDDPAAMASEIRAARADMLFVAMGSPKQERFIERHGDAMQVPVRMGVGGSFDVFSGLTPRAPRLPRRLGLEWLYRCVVEPRKYLRRYARTIPVFLYMFIRHLCSPARRRAALDNTGKPAA